MTREELLWRQLGRLAAGEGLPLHLTLEPADAVIILREVQSLQRIIREMGTCEALLIRDVYEFFPRLS
jgi:hypothetical protein